MAIEGHGHSIRRKLMVPLIGLGLVLGLGSLWMLRHQTTLQLGELVLRRAELVAHMVNHAAQHVSHRDDLQRVVTAIGAEEGILDIIVAGGDPVVVLASTSPLWSGRPLADLPGEEMADDLNKAIRERKAHSHYNEQEQLFDYSIPLQLGPSMWTKDKPAGGAIMVHLDTRPMAKLIRQDTLMLAIVIVISLVLAVAFGYLLVNRLVLKPLAQLRETVRRDADGSSADWDSLGLDDELGQLTTTVRASLQKAVAARHELENQKFALDQHAIVAVTDIQGLITYANDRFCAISGYARSELLGQNHRLLKSGRHPAGYYSDMWKTVAKGKVWHGEICNRAKDGREYWVDSTIAPLLGTDGKPKSYIAIRTDISARKAMEVQLQAAKEAADAGSRAKSEFLATMSHEIRTPMNGVIGFTDILIETTLTPAQRRSVEMIRTSGENLLVLINDILDFTKIESGKMALEDAPFDLRRCVEDVVHLLEAQASKKRLLLSLEIAPAVPRWLMGDAARVRQILLNFTGNAIKFTETGHVRVAFGLESTGCGLVVRGEVTDTGIGLSAEQQERLFQKFSQADASTTRRFGGTGLGLAICKSLIEAMGGRLGVESVLGEGSTFWFTLPLREAPALAETDGAMIGSSTTSPQTQAFTPGLTLTDHFVVNAEPGNATPVLVVDDSEINLLLATSFIQSLGLTAETAANGRIAVEMAAGRSYRLILMDFHMPEMDGLRATEEIRKNPGPNQATPIVGLSASLDDREHCLECGMNEFLAKPLRKSELQRLLVAMPTTKT